MASTEVEVIDTGWKREPDDAPSARFGWYGTAPRATLVAVIVTACLLFLMTIGNHEGHTEDVYLVGIGVIILLWAVFASIPRKGVWKR